MALTLKVAEIDRLECRLRRHAPAVLGTLADERGVRPVVPADLDRWEAAAFEALRGDDGEGRTPAGVRPSQRYLRRG